MEGMGKRDRAIRVLWWMLWEKFLGRSGSGLDAWGIGNGWMEKVRIGREIDMTGRGVADCDKRSARIPRSRNAGRWYWEREAIKRGDGYRQR